MRWVYYLLLGGQTASAIRGIRRREDYVGNEAHGTEAGWSGAPTGYGAGSELQPARGESGHGAGSELQPARYGAGPELQPPRGESFRARGEKLVFF